MTTRYIIITTLFALSINLAKAQIHERVDSVAQEICKSFNEYDHTIDSAIIVNTFQLHLSRYLATMSEEAKMRTLRKIDIRLQTTCQKYVDYVSATANKNWIHVADCPRSTLSDAALKQFFEIVHFRYVEGSGDTTNMKLTKNEWIDYMKDSTYSRLSLKMLSPSDFVIKFVESNNVTKTNMSKVGDEYYYSIISKGKNFYTLCVSVRTLAGGTLFKVYY